MQTFLSNCFIVAGWIGIGVAAILLVRLYLREMKARRAAVRGPKNDLANMMILLQTMRDMLNEQKALARDFNRSVDSKVTIIRKVIRAVADEYKRLNETHRELRQMMQATQADLARIRAHATAIRAQRTRPKAVAPLEMAASEAPAANGLREALAEPSPDAAPTLEVLAEPAGSDSEDDLIDNWVGLDFAGDEPNPYAFEVPEEAPEAPEDPETAREAFRRLLNVSNEASQGNSTKQDDSASPEKSNGRNRSDAVRARVLEYSDAGMSVSEIARELGLGKGEVRLILNIGAKQASRPASSQGLRRPQGHP